MSAEKWRRDSQVDGPDAAAEGAAFAPLAPIPERVPLPEGYPARLLEAFGAAHARAARLHEAMCAQWGAHYSSSAPVPVDEEGVGMLVAWLESAETRVAAPHYAKHDATFVAEALGVRGLEPVHVWRWAVALSRGADSRYVGWMGDLLAASRRANDGRPDLRELAHAAAHHGVPAETISRAELESDDWEGLGDSPEQAWTFFAEHPSLLERALEASVGPDGWIDYFAQRSQRNAYAILAAFPSLPEGAEAIAWRHALGKAKTPRPWARVVLGHAPDRVERAAAALSDGQAEIRATAAEWLGEIGDPAAVAPLERALAAERREAPKASMLRALDALGVDLSPHLDREALQREAKRKLKKGVPSKLSWFPFDEMPAPRWRQDGAPVARESLVWMLVSAHGVKRVAPSPLLPLYAAQWEGADALGDFVLAAWIARDVQPRAAGGRPKGSAQADKGLLAIPAAMGGAAVASLVEGYLRDWYGWRAPQCKALLEMLAHRDDDASVQLLLSTAARFRTSGIRKEAERRVEELAARRGWTPAELADRTAPTAGFELDPTIGRPTLALDVGPRVLRALLDDSLAVVLEVGDGKAIKTFPKPRVADDPERFAEAKKAFAAARKTVKKVLRTQRDRLYDAMCADQRWDVDTWRVHLWRHPLVGRLCERLVWVALRGEEEVATFRPIEDGTLTDVDDEPLRLPEGVEIAVAHRTRLGPERAARWSAHLSDYEVKAPFSQLSAAPVERPDDDDSNMLAPAFGHSVDGRLLRIALREHGYRRGPVEEGGWLYAYERPFATLGLTAFLEISGHSIDAEQVPVALLGVTFHRTREGAPSRALPLRELPPALLAEVSEHVRQAAALGTGPDPLWEGQGP